MDILYHTASCRAYWIPGAKVDKQVHKDKLLAAWVQTMRKQRLTERGRTIQTFTILNRPMCMMGLTLLIGFARQTVQKWVDQLIENPLATNRVNGNKVSSVSVLQIVHYHTQYNSFIVIMHSLHQNVCTLQLKLQGPYLHYTKLDTSVHKDGQHGRTALFHLTFCLQGQSHPISAEGQHFHQFCSTLVDKNAEFRPDKNKRWLPTTLFLSIKAIYHACKHDYIQTQDATKFHMQYATLGTLWQRTFSDVELPKANPFAQCDKCYELQGKAKIADGQRAEAYRGMKSKHLQDVLADRTIYWQHR